MLGQKIKAMREKAKLTKQDFAKKIDANCSSVTQWEHEQCNPSVKYIHKIANVLHCSVDELLESS